ncbi:MAG TPA: hypothetical protein VKU42_02880 [Candidatus Angelobacter sp.]|nr:hypothetical protein [Candidatus Angelobacter sp.]
MAFFGSILRALAPLALEHGTPVLRNWWKARGQAKADPLQQLAGEMDQLKAHAEQVDSNLENLNTNLEKLNRGLTAREERMRRWLLVLIVWNVAMTAGLVLLAVFPVHR